VHPEVRPGKHHFDGDYHAIVSLILARLELGTNRHR
jgi:type IV secretory pathway VirJ component